MSRDIPVDQTIRIPSTWVALAVTCLRAVDATERVNAGRVLATLVVESSEADGRVSS